MANNKSILDINIPVPHWIIRNDADYFMLHPDRLFRARPYYEGEFGADCSAVDESGVLGEVNFVIVNKIPGGRIRHPLNITALILPDDDRSISTFLKARLSASRDVKGRDW